MRTPTSIAAIVLLLAGACSRTSPVAPSEPGTFVMAPGQAVSYGALSVTFVGVSADSRCPGDALCVQFVVGDATVVLATTIRGSSNRYDLQINDATKRRVANAGFLIELSELSPYPFLSHPIAPGDYRATIVISRD